MAPVSHSALHTHDRNHTFIFAHTRPLTTTNCERNSFTQRPPGPRYRNDQIQSPALFFYSYIRIPQTPKVRFKQGGKNKKLPSTRDSLDRVYDVPLRIQLLPHQRVCAGTRVNRQVKRHGVVAMRLLDVSFANERQRM